MTRTAESRKRTAWVLMLCMLMSLFAPTAASAAEGDTPATPVVLAEWNATATPATAEVPATTGAAISVTSGAAVNAVLTSFAGITPGYASSALSVAGWNDGANQKYWQILVSTKGYEALTLVAKHRSSGTGPRDFKVICSTDLGASWMEIPGSAYAVTGSKIATFMPTLTLPGDAADREQLLIRFIMTGNISSRAGTSTYAADEAVASGGTSSINNIVLTGVPLGSGTPTQSASASASASATASASADPTASASASPTASASASPSPTPSVAPVEASPAGGAVTAGTAVALTCATTTAAIQWSLDGGATWSAYDQPITLNTLPAALLAKATADGMLPSETTSFAYTELVPGERQLYFGQLHSHTNFSDGIGSVTDAYSHAKAVPGLDFLAVTDHSNSFDNAASASITNGAVSSEWVSGRAAADAATDSTFVGLFGYEMTWSNGTGHINTFNTAGFETRTNSVYSAADGLQKYYSVLKGQPDSISQFNHPGDTFGNFNDFASYDPAIDARISLIEVGNGEGAVRSSGYFPSYEQYVRALDKGWHLSPTNNQDNHLGKWGDANAARTVVLADSLTKDAIQDAMRNRRTYATEDSNLRISYTLNGAEMGAVLPTKPAEAHFHAVVQDPDGEEIGTVSVISEGGKTIMGQTVPGSTQVFDGTVPVHEAWYFIRVDQPDGDIAVTAPIWVDEVDKAGISSFAATTAVPMAGRPVTLKTSLFNNESSDMGIVALAYSIDGTVLHTSTGLSLVTALGVAADSFDWTPSSAGKQVVDVRLEAVVNGETRIYEASLQLNVQDPATTVRVALDASHYNDYISGYYANNHSNFVTLAGQKGVVVSLITGSITPEALQDVEMLVLSAPAKKAGTANGAAYPASPYTDAEIAAIQAFAADGGSLVVVAIADYNDSRTDATLHGAYQQNRVLAAVGAGSRINDDEVVDYESNPNVVPAGVAGGTPYRVPMSVYDFTSPLLDGVVASQNYSFYSGCSITLDSDAQALVKGWPTTYGFDSDNDGNGGAYVAAANKTMPADTGIGKGNVVALAKEPLPGGGMLYIGGTVFFSNFEIKTQLDNATQLQNSNWNITGNLLASLEKEVPVTSIAAVRAAATGSTFCVEGTVTAGTETGRAFFDTIYVQDATGGINLFPVSDIDARLGMKVRATGTRDAYQGDVELRVTKVEIIDATETPLVPENIGTGAAMLDGNGGRLLKVDGTVVAMDAQNLYLDDGSGSARIFVDGYIGDGSGNAAMLGKWDAMIQVGDHVQATGLASVDPIGARLRVRNTAEIVRIRDTVPPVITVTGIADGDIRNATVQPEVSTNEGTLAVTMDGVTFTGGAVGAEGWHLLSASAVDRDGNESTVSIRFLIDKTAPVIAVFGIRDGETLLLRASRTIGWSASDALSGIETATGGVVSGGKLDTSVVGDRAVVLTATDKAGNQTVRTIRFKVRYRLFDWTVGHGGRWIHGPALLVSFGLQDANRDMVKNATATLSIARVVNGRVGPESPAVSLRGASAGNRFIYDSGWRRYLFDLSTRGLQRGEYQLRIDAGDGSTNLMRIFVR